MSELLRGLPPLLASHLELVLLALLIAAAISLPLAVVVAARPRLSFATLAVAGVIQTVPGLALLALMVPVLAQGASRKEFWRAVVSIPSFFVLRVVNSVFVLEAIWSEWVVKRPFLIYEKGH